VDCRRETEVEQRQTSRACKDLVQKLSRWMRSGVTKGQIDKFSIIARSNLALNRCTMVTKEVAINPNSWVAEDGSSPPFAMLCMLSETQKRLAPSNYTLSSEDSPKSVIFDATFLMPLQSLDIDRINKLEDPVTKWMSLS